MHRWAVKFRTFSHTVDGDGITYSIPVYHFVKFESLHQIFEHCSPDQVIEIQDTDVQTIEELNS